MIDKEKVSIWMESHSGLIGLCGLIVGLIGLAIVIILTWRQIGKMIIEILGIVFIVIFSYITIKSAIFLIRRPLNEEIRKLKSKYNELVELTKLPKTFDRAITIEKSPDGGMSAPILIPYRYGKIPHFGFDMRVINRTYYSFEAEEATSRCFCGQEEVCKGTWDNKTRKSETFELVKDLPVWGSGDGAIMFHCPIKKLYGDMKTWRLRGTVKYKLRGSLIDDNQYANPEIDIELEYVLSEKQISELKKEVEKALGDDI